MSPMKAQAGVARTSLTPYWGVELTGWGYYLERTWQTVHDPLFATALIIDNGSTAVGIVSLDLMVIGGEFTDNVRRLAAEATGLLADNILVCCTHTHNAPASQGLLGVGEVDPFYEQWAARQAATALIQAWRSREEATFSAASTRVEDLTFNRTRENGPVDPHLTALRINRAEGSPLAVVVGFQAHPTVTTVLRPRAVSRDVPGEVCDHLEQALPGCTALYLQGACGDVNFHRACSENEQVAQEPARRLAKATLTALEGAKSLDGAQLAARVQTVRLPTRRWMREEIDADRDEALQRLRDRDLAGWRDSIGRVMTTRPLEMVERHGGDEWRAVAAMCRFNQEWTDRMLADLDERPEWLDTQIQALRIGEMGIVSNASEFFTTLALQVREQVALPQLMLACYANGRIGYLPDAHDVERRTYAAYQSPKYCNQFPFTAESGPTMVAAMCELMNSL